MKTLAKRVPLRDGDTFQLVEETSLPFEFLNYALAGGNYPILEKIIGGYYKYYKNAMKDEKNELILLTPRKKTIDTKSLKGAISDTICQNKIIEADAVEAITSLIFTLNAGHWWMKYGLPAFMLISTAMTGYTYGTWLELLLAGWLMKGREYAMAKNIEKLNKEYFDKTRKGIKLTYKNIDEIKEVEHKGLKKLNEIIEKEQDKTEAYIKALHSAGKFGLPELKSFYSFNSPINEWKVKEVGTTFPVYENLSIEPNSFKRTKYKSTHQRLKEEEMELFDYNLRPKIFAKNKTFDDWHKDISEVAKNLGAEEITVYTTRRGKPVNFYAVGDEKAPFRFLIKGGHEDEFRYMPAIYQMMSSFLKEGSLTDKVLSKVKLYFLECDDPDGFDMRAWTAVDMNGDEVHWPPEYFSMFNGKNYTQIFSVPSTGGKEELRNFARKLIAKDVTKNIYVKGSSIYRDENGVYGDEIRSKRILSIQKFIHDEVRPHVAVDLHETVRGASAYLVYQNAGILEIGHYPIQEKTLEKIYSITKMKKPYTLMSYFSIVPIIKKLLKNNVGFELGGAMMENVRKRGFKAYGDEFQTLLEAPAILPQLVAVDEGRTIWGWYGNDAEIAVCPDWMRKNYGTLGYTTETFPNSLPEVVMEDMAYIEGGLKHIIKRW